MHAVHHTDAFILKSAPSGEANRRVWLFTREFGHIVAVVQGVRKQGAKLQMQLSDYSLCSVDLVKGRDVWRLVSASEMQNPFIGRNANGLGRAFVRTLSAVERFCHGEEANEALFLHLLECMNVLFETGLDAKSFDTVSLWKTLATLGYIAVEEVDETLFRRSFIDAVRTIDSTTRSRLIKAINETITETHL